MAIPAVVDKMITDASQSNQKPLTPNRLATGIVLTTIGTVVGGALGAEFGLRVNPPILGIATGVALGTGCGVMISMQRLSPVVAYILHAMACFCLILFPYTAGQGVYVVLVGASIGIVASRFSRAAAWPALGALFAIAILVIPCESYGRAIYDSLVGNQMLFIIVMAVVAFGAALSVTGFEVDTTVTRASDRKFPAWYWFVAAGILGFLVLSAISVYASRKPPM